MNFFFWLTIMLWALACRAEPVDETRAYHVYSTEEMFNITSGAVLKREDVKLLTKNAETWGLRQVHSVGIDERYAEPVVLGLAPFAFRKASTRGLHFHWEPVKNLTLRPDVEYYLDSREFNATFTLTWDF